MPNFTYTRDIPFSSHNPSVDQPDMQINNNSIQDIIAVDHYGFNDGDNLSGYHKIIHLPPQTNDPVAITGIGQVYTKNVNGDQQLYYESGNGVVGTISNPSGIITQAAVVFTVTATVVNIVSSYNVTSVVRNSLGNYSINFTTPLGSANYYVSIFSGGIAVSQIGPTAPSASQLNLFILNAITPGFYDPPSVRVLISL